MPNAREIQSEVTQVEISQEVSQEIPQEEQFENQKKRKRGKTSVGWNEFIVVVVDGVQKAECMHCKVRLSYTDGGTTSHLKRHIPICIPRIAATSGKGKGLKQTTLSLDGHDGLTTYKFEQEKAIYVLAKAIIAHEYPFKMVEHELFVLFCKILNPHFNPINRKPIREYCLRVYECEKSKLRSVLTSVGNIGLTSDLWTSNQTVGYMCLTGHFVDSDWNLQKRVLNFCCLPPPHTGVNIADCIFQCLIAWGIEEKVSSITLDNSSANDAAVTSLLTSFGEKIYFGGKIFHVRCCAHILNLMVQDGLKEIKRVVENVRESVKYVTLTPSRLHKFNEIVKQLKLPSTQSLILDVPTRWNSTYDMLRTALIFKDVFSRYKDRDSQYLWLPSDEEWARASEVCRFLKIFNDATKVFSVQFYPTSNLYFPEIWKIKQILLQMSVDTREWIVRMLKAMSDKFDKYWEDCSLLMAIGAALDPRNKLKYIEFVFNKLYPTQSARNKLKDVRDAMIMLFEEYVSKEVEMGNISQESCATNNNSSEITESRSEFEMWATQINCTQSNTMSEMEIYLDEGIYIGCEGTLDVLKWWKANTLKFRILSKMARDILSIPVTSVASESAFSAAGRVIDDHRSSLSEETIEALVCSGDWLRTEFGIGKSVNSHTT